MANTASTHDWSFTHAGGFDQVRLTRGSDYEKLGELDQKLWAALACPVKGLELDERTLALIDTDGDARIRPPEMIAAVGWAREHLKDLGDLTKRESVVPLDRMRDDTDSGKAVVAAARRMLAGLGRGDATSVSMDDVNETARFFAESRLNGDGVVPAESANDEATSTLIAEIVDCMGAIADRSGKDGVDEATLEAFFEQARALCEWADRPAAEETLLPAGDGTDAAADAWRAVRVKIDDWFARARLAEFDPRAVAALNRKEEEYLELASADLTVSAEEIAAFPLARVESMGPLHLVNGLNPAWAAAMAAFRTATVDPMLGEGTVEMSEEQWGDISGRLAAHEKWLSEKPETATEKVGLERLREILGGTGRDDIAALINEDKELEAEFQAIEQVERLVRYHRDLDCALSSFVHFLDFYSRKRPATFQAGTLYLDGRSCELCIRVDDPGKHAALAAMAKAYLAYCTCTRPSGEKMNIVAAFTGGDSDYLLVGRNGVFYDRKGRDWDATITKVVENPISIREAFWAPYKKVVRLIEGMAAKRAAAAEAASDKKLAGAATATEKAATTAPAGAPPAEEKKIDVGTVAALGVAVGAIGTMLTAIVGYATGMLTLPFWQVTLIILAIFILISTPSMAIAWLKLRQRNLAPLLDASGWAVNGRVRLSVPFGGSLTSVASRPRGAKAASDDPYAEKPSMLPGLLVFVVALCFVYSVLNSLHLVHKWSEGRFGDVPAEVVAK